MRQKSACTQIYPLFLHFHPVVLNGSLISHQCLHNDLIFSLSAELWVENKPHLYLLYDGSKTLQSLETVDPLSELGCKNTRICAYLRLYNLKIKARAASSDVGEMDSFNHHIVLLKNIVVSLSPSPFRSTTGDPILEVA